MDFTKFQFYIYINKASRDEFGVHHNVSRGPTHHSYSLNITKHCIPVGPTLHGHNHNNQRSEFHSHYHPTTPTRTIIIVLLYYKIYKTSPLW